MKNISQPIIKDGNCLGGTGIPRYWLNLNFSQISKLRNLKGHRIHVRRNFCLCTVARCEHKKKRDIFPKTKKDLVVLSRQCCDSSLRLLKN